MPSEKESRRPEWIPGHEAKLADGATWTFRKPRIRFRPKFKDGKATVKQETGLGPESDALFDIVTGVTDCNVTEWMSARFEFLANLLKANYTLTDDDLSDLLVIDPDDEAVLEVWDGLTRMAKGLAPKPIADISNAVV